MKCQFCGAPLDGSFKFCTHCGKENTAGQDSGGPHTGEADTAVDNIGAAGRPEDGSQQPSLPAEGGEVAPDFHDYEPESAPNPAAAQQSPQPQNMPFEGSRPPQPQNMPYGGGQPPQPQNMPYGGGQPPQPQSMPYPNQNAPGYYGFNPPVKKSRLPIIIICATVFVLLLAGGAVFAYNTYFSGVNELFRIMNTTAKAYGDELDVLFDDNPVLSDVKNIFGDSFSLVTAIDEIELGVNLDRESKILDLELKDDSSELDARLYFTEDQLFFGVENVFYTHSAYTDLPQQLSAFLENNDLGLNDSDIEAFKEALEDSENNSDYTSERNQKEFLELWKSITGAAEFSKETESIKIGSEKVSCDRYSLIYDKEILADWVENDAEKFLNSGASFFDFFTGFLQGSTGDYESIDADDFIDGLLDELNDLPRGFELEIYFSAYKNVIVSAGFEAVSTGLRGSSGTIGFSISATGGDYRLNCVTLAFTDSYDDAAAIVFEGNHIGSPVVESELRFVESDYADDIYEINWDTGKQKNNLSIVNYYDGDSYDDFSITFASKGDQVLLDLDEELKLALARPDAPIALPDNSIPLADFRIEDLYAEIFGSEFGEFIY